MNKQNEFIRFRNQTKSQHFIPKSADRHARQPSQAPQISSRKTNANNRYLSGRGW
jgi:hypothetical protein